MSDRVWIETTERVRSERGELQAGKAYLVSPDEADRLIEKGAAERMEAEEWTKKMDPERYLEQYPDGPSAPLARRVLADG